MQKCMYLFSGAGCRQKFEKLYVVSFQSPDFQLCCQMRLCHFFQDKLTSMLTFRGKQVDCLGNIVSENRRNVFFCNMICKYMRILYYYILFKVYIFF